MDTDTLILPERPASPRLRDTTAIDYREMDLAGEGAENADPFFLDFVRDDFADWQVDLISAAMRVAFIGTDDTKAALQEAARQAREAYVRAFHAYAKGHYKRIAKDEVTA